VRTASSFNVATKRAGGLDALIHAAPNPALREFSRILQENSPRCGGPFLSTVIDDDHLEVPERLGLQRSEAFHKHGIRRKRRNHHRDAGSSNLRLYALSRAVVAHALA